MYTRGIEARSAGVGMTRRCIVVHSGSGIGDRSVFAEEAALFLFLLFFQAEDGIRDIGVTGVQTCALPISSVTTSCISPPYAPAFIITPPPIVPGMPTANSSLLRPWIAAVFETTASSAPDWA